MKIIIKRFVLISGLTGVFGIWYMRRFSSFPNQKDIVYSKEEQKKICSNSLPTRAQQIENLKKKEFDVLVIGGGATGCGIALDSTTRGLSTALVEKFDYSSGTSSRSTKLIHGGVRYLHKAVTKLDKEQYNMVKEALLERTHFLQVAPHLAKPLPIMLPVYKFWQVPYFFAGIKLYDLLSGESLLKNSYWLSKQKALDIYPVLSNQKLKGSIVYYDGIQDDSRMCLSLIITAIKYGACAVNHTEVVELIKKKKSKPKKPKLETVPVSGKNIFPEREKAASLEDAGEELNETVTCGVKVRNKLTGEEYDIYAKVVINATGPFVDMVRAMDDSSLIPICQPSSGIHVVLPDYYSPKGMGLIQPSTSDNRVIFLIPWLGNTMAGTTDRPCQVVEHPSPSEDELQWIMKEIKNYLSPEVRVKRADVMSVWSGIRPLVVDPSAKNTQSIARNHVIQTSPSQLITIAGGKWTTYRKMAQDTVDKAIQVGGLNPKHECQSKDVLLEGSHDWSPTYYIRLVQDFGLESKIAKHLADTYGDKSINVAKLSKLTGIRWPMMGRRLHSSYPFIEAEILYAITEYAETVIDVLSRRTRICFLNNQAALEVLPKVVDLMAKELNWTNEKKEQETKDAKNFLFTELGLGLKPKEGDPFKLSAPVKEKKYIELKNTFHKDSEVKTKKEQKR